MGIARGTNIVRDGLAFGYDSGYGVADPGVSTRFYKGKPTTNIASGAALIHDTAGGSAGSVVDAPEKGPGWKKVTITAIGTNFRVIQFGSYPTMSSDVTYASSFEADWGNMRGKGYYITQDGTGGGNRNYFKNGNYATGSTNVVDINSGLLDGHFGMNITRTGTHVHVPFIYNTGSTSTSGRNDYFYYKEYQQEVGTIPTPYVNGTRSDTASLIDLKRTKSIDVGDISFDSTGQPDFDGSSDYIGLNHADSPTTNFSYELVIKFDSLPASNGYMSIFQKQTNWNNAGGIMMQFIYNNFRWSYGNAWTGAVSYAQSNFTTGKYYHIVGTVDNIDGDNAKLYVNGVQVSSTGTGSKPNTTANLTIGKGNGGNHNGKIDVFKMYENTITADGVKQNYKAYKNRFNI